MDRTANEGKEEEIKDNESEGWLDAFLKQIDDRYTITAAHIDEKLKSRWLSKTDKAFLTIIRAIVTQQHADEALLLKISFQAHETSENVLSLEKTVKNILEKEENSDTELQQIRKRIIQESRKIKEFHPILKRLKSDYEKREEWLNENK